MTSGAGATRSLRFRREVAPARRAIAERLKLLRPPSAHPGVHMEKDAILRGIIEKMGRPDWVITQDEYAVLMADMNARLNPTPSCPTAAGEYVKSQHEVGLTREEIKQLKAEG